jgi:hypothetical protein
MPALTALWAVEPYTADSPQALVLLGAGIFTLAVVLPGVSGLARGTAREFGVRAISEGGRRALIALFAAVGLALLAGGVITIVVGLMA